MLQSHACLCFSASRLDQIFTPLKNQDIDRIGAVVDILIDVMIKRIKDYPGISVVFGNIYRKLKQEVAIPC